MTSRTSSETSFVEEDMESIEDVANLSLKDFEGEKTSLGSRDLFSAQIRYASCRNTSTDL